MEVLACAFAALSGAMIVLLYRRTRALTSLVNLLQQTHEDDRRAITEKLHNELSGMLVSARLYATALEQHRASIDAGQDKRLQGLNDVLHEALALQRRLSAQLRPPLLDHAGLIPAIRSHLQGQLTDRGIEYSEEYRLANASFTAEASIALFRIVEELVAQIVDQARPGSLHLMANLAEPRVQFTLRYTHCPAEHSASTVVNLATRFRIRHLGGHARSQYDSRCHAGEIRLDFASQRILSRATATG